MQVLHVLSQAQCVQFLTRLARCARDGAVLVGACVGVASEQAGEWMRTPDGQAPRWLHSRTSLADMLRATGWGEQVDVRTIVWDASSASSNANANTTRAGTDTSNVAQLQFVACKTSVSTSA